MHAERKIIIEWNKSIVMQRHAKMQKPCAQNAANFWYGTFGIIYHTRLCVILVEINGKCGVLVKVSWRWNEINYYYLTSRNPEYTSWIKNIHCKF
jgi:hypothetical protein